MVVAQYAEGAVRIETLHGSNCIFAIKQMSH